MIALDTLVRANTPWDEVAVGPGRMFHVKREDLSSPGGGPRFSKIRGVAPHIAARPESLIGVLDTYHSKAGWAVAAVCAALGRECRTFWPRRKVDLELGPAFQLRESQARALAFGAKLRPLEAGRSAILYHRARAETERDGGYMMPNALKLPESVEATAVELAEHTPAELLVPSATWIVSASSATLAAGVLLGLRRRGADPSVVIHLGYHRPESAVYKGVVSAAGAVWTRKVRVVDEGYDYTEPARADGVEPPPFPCNPFYDLKAWAWAVKSAAELGDPVVFWNIGE